VSLLSSLRALLIRRLRARSVLSLVRMACWAALLGLGFLTVSILNPRPLSVIFAMGLGHVIGGFALLCYLLAIALDSVRGGADPTRPGKVNDGAEQPRGTASS